ncbi:hypothetical protein T440DRAFT_484003 [Plenodomus tracheiphilus IPT5]|uniref:Uncharacterized protein n=1 Tax=Plenodomus tracheiphilus IPT5 TaxID=1408161 RepID=A0A6A7AR47_9PLEO|nr:hypothetical protein T440DRAFT_484003 [Plenodomus tracheiphilus IPT5]
MSTTKIGKGDNNNYIIVPKELYSKFSKLNKLLRCLCNSKEPNLPPKNLRTTYIITKEQKELYKFKVTKIYTPLAKMLLYKKATYSKNIANKRTKEAIVEKELKNIIEEPSIPCKKA